MAVDQTRPIWWKRDTDTDWGEEDEAVHYEFIEQDRQHLRGEFIENLCTFCFLTIIGGGVLVRAHIGTEDANTGINYEHQNHPNVAQTLREVPKYADFIGALEQAGVAPDTDDYNDILQRFQNFVDLAKETTPRAI